MRISELGPAMRAGTDYAPVWRRSWPPSAIHLPIGSMSSGRLPILSAPSHHCCSRANCFLDLENGETFHLQAGSLLLLPHGDAHIVRSSHEGRSRAVQMIDEELTSARAGAL